MKTIIRMLITLVIIGLLGFGLWRVRPTAIKNTTPIVTGVMNSVTYNDIQAATPYDALVLIAKNNNLELQTKQYDFGIFVEGVGDQKMTKDKAWIYYVNGKSGEVASDTYVLKQGDIVEWKYTTPIY